MEWVHLRKYPRTKVNIPVECLWNGKKSVTRALTLGGGGLFLAITQDLPAGAALTVRFHPARHLPLVDARAEVRYQLPGRGIGIAFKEIKPEDRQMILRLILDRLTKKRRYPRVRFVTQVETDQGTFLGVSRNISVGGMFIEIKESPPEDSIVKVRFHLNGVALIFVSAEVRYAVAKVGIGVKFLDLSPADMTHIDEYVTRGETASSEP